jgi:hypothetical protein
MPYFNHLSRQENEANAIIEARMEAEAEAVKKAHEDLNHKRKDKDKDVLTEHVWDFLKETGQVSRIY